jgi:hypothetical protein
MSIGLPPELTNQCRKVLLQCEEFHDYETLITVFVTDELLPFKSQIRKANNRKQLIDYCFEDLLQKYTKNSDPILPIFLATLKDRYDQENALYHELKELCTTVDSAFQKNNFCSQQSTNNITHQQNQENGQFVRKGLDALIDLMQISEVRDIVIAFRTDFQAACEQIKVLADYKDLHDLLHQLQFHCYNGIVQEISRFPRDDVSITNLENYELTLQDIIYHLQNIVSDASLASKETLWVENLVQAKDELCAAIENADINKLKRSVWLINRVLAIQPSQINTRLNETARVLRLSFLANAMMSVYKSLETIELDYNNLTQFETGAQALAVLSQDLSNYIKLHDQWQLVDLELRRIDSNLEKDIIELEMSWKYLKEMTEPLHNTITEQWAQSFRLDSEKLDNALKVQNPTKIKQYFQRYRNQAGFRFHQVDLALKKLCENLRRIGEPLVLLLRMV